MRPYVSLQDIRKFQRKQFTDCIAKEKRQIFREKSGRTNIQMETWKENLPGNKIKPHL